jgi:hypothetical protein
MTTRPKAILSDDIARLRMMYPALFAWPNLAIEAAWSNYSKAICCQPWLTPESAMPDIGFLDFCAAKRTQYPKRASSSDHAPSASDWM